MTLPLASLGVFSGKSSNPALIVFPGEEVSLELFQSFPGVFVLNGVRNEKGRPGRALGHLIEALEEGQHTLDRATGV